MNGWTGSEKAFGEKFFYFSYERKASVENGYFDNTSYLCAYERSTDSKNI